MTGKTGGPGNGKPVQRSGRRLGLEKEYTSWKDLSGVAWQFPLLAFIIYFTYFYLE